MTIVMTIGIAKANIDEIMLAWKYQKQRAKKHESKNKIKNWRTWM